MLNPASLHLLLLLCTPEHLLLCKKPWSPDHQLVADLSTNQCDHVLHSLHFLCFLAQTFIYNPCPGFPLEDNLLNLKSSDLFAMCLPLYLGAASLLTLLYGLDFTCLLHSHLTLSTVLSLTQRFWSFCLKQHLMRGLTWKHITKTFSTDFDSYTSCIVHEPFHDFIIFPTVTVFESF